MLLRPIGNNRNNPRHSHFGGFLQRPLHALEAEDRKQQSYFDGQIGNGKLFGQLELDTLVGDAADASAAHAATSHDVELLADLSPEHPREVVGVFVEEESAVA